MKWRFILIREQDSLQLATIVESRLSHGRVVPTIGWEHFRKRSIPFALLLSEYLRRQPIEKNSELVEHIIRDNETKRLEAGCLNAHHTVQNMFKCVAKCSLGIRKKDRRKAKSTGYFRSLGGEESYDIVD
ncbi:hypothetical protein RND71_031199 [Anisodus tanguticus]|uniref:DUF7795 domain-containing protein n=1 Tax=Anisodus tanguticus TaxID=243964 RepID=A0AAE1V4K9_9SOLA|nr:hypothetical protein RND71_031199 [Anisodus tanguticus]